MEDVKTETWRDPERWSPSDIPPAWRPVPDAPEKLVATLAFRDRGGQFTSAHLVTKADFLRAGPTKRDCYAWLQNELAQHRAHVERTLARVARVNPLAIDGAGARLVLQEFEGYWPGAIEGVPEFPRALLYERLRLVLAQARAEFNLDGDHKTPLEDTADQLLSRHEEAREAAPEAQAAPRPEEAQGGVLTT